MSTKSAKIKSANGTLTAKRSTATNGTSSKTSARKKPLNERWIEKYGVDDSEAAKSLLRAWKKTYENRNKRID